MKQTSLFDDFNESTLKIERSTLLYEDLDIRSILSNWADLGWIRAIDLELALHLSDIAPNTSAWVTLALAMTSHQLGRGHICIDLERVYSDPDRYLALPPEFGLTAGAVLPSTLFNQLSSEQWLAQFEHDSMVGPPNENKPLVLEGSLLYMRRLWHTEVHVAQGIVSRLQTSFDVDTSTFVHLEELFGQSNTLDWQRVACAVAVSQKLSVITGGPGTGKTTTVVKILALLQRVASEKGSPLEIALAAPTGKAAARLATSIKGAISQLPQTYQCNIPSSVDTIHRLIGVSPSGGLNRYRKGEPLPIDLLVVDEASMIDIELFAALLDAISENTQLVFLGDKDQLASVEAGAVLADVCRHASAGGYSEKALKVLDHLAGASVSHWQSQLIDVPTQVPLNDVIAMLRVSYRFGSDSGIGYLADVINKGDAGAALNAFKGSFDDISRQSSKSLKQGLSDLILSSQGYRPYLEAMTTDLQDPLRLLALFDQFRILSGVRRGPEGVESINDMCEQILMSEGLIDASSEWYPGRPIMITANDYAIGLANGDVGLCLMRDNQLSVAFTQGDGCIKWVHPMRLESVETAYAMTVHKAQGSEFSHTVYVSPSRNNPVLTRELLYTAVTRASKHFTLLELKQSVLEQTIASNVARASGLYNRIQALS